MMTDPLSDTSRRDVFLSHATSDKERYVRPFARELDRRRISYWLDEAEILWGDKITAKVNQGLARSACVVVFLSNAFVGRNWTEAELGSALSRENAEGRTVVLPILIGDPAALLAYYPLLRDKAYLPWSLGVSSLADELQKIRHRRWSKAELDNFVADHVDLEQFAKGGIWSPGYRLLLACPHFGEGAYFFWNEETRTVEKYWLDAVRSHGSEPLNAEDVQLVRDVVLEHVKRAT